MQAMDHGSATGVLAKQCREAMENVTFHDMATRQLFETLINQADTSAVGKTAEALGRQKLL